MWNVSPVPQDVEIKEEGVRHMLILYHCSMDMAGSVDFSAANAKSSAQLRVKGDRETLTFVYRHDEADHLHLHLTPGNL